MVRGALTDDHLIQLKVVTETLNTQKYQDKILESSVRQGWSTHTRTCTRTYSSTFFQYLAVLCT